MPDYLQPSRWKDGTDWMFVLVFILFAFIGGTWTYYEFYFQSYGSLPSVQVQLPQYAVDYFILVFGELTVLVIAAIVNLFWKKKENKELVEAIRLLVEEIRAERDARSKSP